MSDLLTLGQTAVKWATYKFTFHGKIQIKVLNTA